jgi:hypothetical protein
MSRHVTPLTRTTAPVLRLHQLGVRGGEVQHANAPVANLLDPPLLLRLEHGHPKPSKSTKWMTPLHVL